MASKAIIDNDILGWGLDVKERIEEEYEKIILVGSIDDLPSGVKDEKIGAYCYENGCDLFTGDTRAYDKFFRDARIKSVIITNYAVYGKGKKLVYRIQIIRN